VALLRNNTSTPPHIRFKNWANKGGALFVDMSSQRWPFQEI
jgi:hypothetical protein